MRHDPRIKRLIRKYQADGYAIYNYILESIAGNLEAQSPIPDLEETAEDIAYDLGVDTLRVNEIVQYCIGQELLSQDEIEGKIICMKMYKFLDDATRKSTKISEMIANFTESGSLGLIPKNTEKVRESPNGSEQVGQTRTYSEKVRLDKDKDKEKDKDIKKHLPDGTGCKQPKKRKSTKAPKDYSAEFESFWEAYPMRNGSKGSKRKAFESWWRAVVRDELVSHGDIVTHIKRLSPSYGEFPPDAVTWINGRRWEDEFDPSQSTHQNGRNSDDLLRRKGAAQAAVVLSTISSVGRNGTPRLSDPVTAEAIRRIGWGNLCSKDQRYMQRDFVEMYVSVAREVGS